jgi:hypothetical protein
LIRLAHLFFLEVHILRIYIYKMCCKIPQKYTAPPPPCPPTFHQKRSWTANGKIPQSLPARRNPDLFWRNVCGFVPITIGNIPKFGTRNIFENIKRLNIQYLTWEKYTLRSGQRFKILCKVVIHYWHKPS